jgi:hypothetical protein
MTNRYRTISGQTGRDAYVFELAQMSNKLRELKTQWQQLCETIADDLPEGTTGKLPIPSDKFPDATLPLDRDALISQISFAGQSLDLIEDVRTLIDLADLDPKPEQPEQQPEQPTFREDAHPDLRAINALGMHRELGGCADCRTDLPQS